MSSTSHPDDFADVLPPLKADHIRRLEPVLHKMAARHSRCAADREDLVQEALLRLTSKTNWTVAIVAAESAMLDYVKSKRSGRREVVVPFGDEQGEYDPAGREPEGIDVLVAQEDAGFVISLLDSFGLPPTQKAMSIRFWVDEQPQSAIAKEFGVSPMTVSKRLAEVRELIEEWFSNRDNE